ncbi:MAG: hypothetical protein EBQ57_03205 [Actinobacteria bacterium]|nr:hypothetical protein [Actinomycetota bacterium]
MGGTKPLEPSDVRRRRDEDGRGVVCVARDAFTRRAPRLTTVRPLEGIRVLDFTRVLAGPHATRMLCDFGAQVIKVEPPVGDLTRFGQPRLNSLATYFIQQNVGKLNVSLNFDDERAIDLARQLADTSDIVIENFRPGVMLVSGLTSTR